MGLHFDPRVGTINAEKPTSMQGVIIFCLHGRCRMNIHSLSN